MFLVPFSSCIPLDIAPILATRLSNPSGSELNGIPIACCPRSQLDAIRGNTQSFVPATCGDIRWERALSFSRHSRGSRICVTASLKHAARRRLPSTAADSESRVALCDQDVGDSTVQTTRPLPAHSSVALIRYLRVLR